MNTTKYLLSAGVMAALIMPACTPATDTDSTSSEPTAMESSSSAMEGVMVGGALMVPNLNIVENAANADNVTTLVAAVEAAELTETLSGTGPFTVFAPTDAAFAKLPEGTVEELLTPAKKADLTSILTYHVVPGRLLAADLTDGQMLTTVNGEELTVSIVSGKVMVNGATIETADVVSSNGVTHVIDTVLLP